MRRGKYIQTAQGQAHLYDQRTLQRVHADVAGDPLSKNALKSKRTLEHKLHFQAEASRWLTRLNLSPLRGSVVVDFTFTPTQANPPSIEKLPKSYLDLLERRVGVSGALTAENLVFKNDRQVKILFARYNLGMGEDPRVSATITAARHFLADLELASRLRSGDFGEPDLDPAALHDDEAGIYGVRQSKALDEALAELRELGRWSEAKRGAMHGAFEGMLLFARYNAQRAALANTDHAIESLFPIVLRGSTRGRSPRSEHPMALLRPLLTGGPFAVAIGHSPRREGDSQDFQDSLNVTAHG